jgi:hypothetical protein
MCAKLSSYLTSNEGDFKITYCREGSASINDDHTSLSSAHAMSIDEYYQQKKNRNMTKKKSKPRKQDSENKKKSSSKKKSKRGPSNNTDPPLTPELYQQNSSASSMAESYQATPARIIKTATTPALASPGVGGSRSIGSILEDIRLIIEEADKDCDEVDVIKDMWQDDISRLLRKWEEQEKKRLLRKQSLFVPPKRSKQIMPASA